VQPLAELARFVAAHLGWLRVRPEAAQAWNELDAAYRRAVRTVDRPEAMWYAGPCWSPVANGAKCEQELYMPKTGQRWIRCHRCGAQWSSEARREWLLASARDYLATATEMARLVAAYAEVISTDFHRMLRLWIHRRRIRPRTDDERGRPMYRVGDVLDLVTDSMARRQVKVGVAA
jgi:hypothetical protein